MGSFGRQVLGSVGTSLSIVADGKPEYKVAGVTIDWSTVTALVADIEFLDGQKFVAGQKVIQYGTPLIEITATGFYGPADTTALDGRAVALADKTFLLPETLCQDDLKSDHPGVIEGGKVWKERLQLGGAGQLTLAQLRAVLPRLSFV